LESAEFCTLVAKREIKLDFFAVRAVTEFSRFVTGWDAERDLSTVTARFTTFFCGVTVVRADTVFVLRGLTAVFRVVVVVFCVRAVGVRVVVFTVSATAPPMVGAIKHAAKNRFRPFISFSF
jgi:hypothetical protein